MMGKTVNEPAYGKLTIQVVGDRPRTYEGVTREDFERLNAAYERAAAGEKPGIVEVQTRTYGPGKRIGWRNDELLRLNPAQLAGVSFVE